MPRAIITSYQTWWLKTMDIYSLRVLEARSLKSRCWQNWCLLVALRDNLLFHASLLAASGCQQLSTFLACSCTTAISVSVFTWSSPLCLCLKSHPLFSRRTPVIAFQVHPKSRILSSQDLQIITSAKTQFPSKLMHRYQGLGLEYLSLF